ncbi:MAG: CPBP family intramembrane metalloprotease, partial [Duncaniella sp.]|nr:CPBP family intramembrane metalloprotease [Duncaniella sp.]
TAGSTIASILIVGVLAGLSEELYFRGALQRLLATSPLGAHTAVWVTATLFSLMHMQFYGLVPRILLGALFGYLFLWTGSIWLPVIIHALNNSIYILSYRNPTAGIDRFGTGDIWLALASAIICFFLLRTLYRRSTSGKLK